MVQEIVTIAWRSAQVQKVYGKVDIKQQQYDARKSIGINEHARCVEEIMERCPCQILDD